MADKLRLEVILDAIDKATAPFKHITESSKAMSKAVKEARDKLKELNKTQDTITSFHKLQKDLAITRYSGPLCQDSLLPNLRW